MPHGRASIAGHLESHRHGERSELSGCFRVIRDELLPLRPARQTHFGARIRCEKSGESAAARAIFVM
jgi:hypothetical protein